MPIPDEDDENTEFRQKFEVTLLLSLCANLKNVSCVCLEKLFLTQIKKVLCLCQEFNLRLNQ